MLNQKSEHIKNNNNKNLIIKNFSFECIIISKIDSSFIENSFYIFTFIFI